MGGRAHIVDSRQGENGDVALWIGFAFLIFGTVSFLFLSYVRNVKSNGRFYYYLITLINAISALAYLIQALGNTNYDHVIDYTEDGCDAATGEGCSRRSFQWIRYAQWAITGPLTLIALGLLAGAHWVEIAFVAVLAVTGVAAGFAAALTTGDHATWPIYAFAVGIFLVIAYQLFYSFRSSAKANREISKLYNLLSLVSGLLYLGYVVFWGTSEGGHIANADQEVIVYTVLDILSKVAFGFVFLFSLESIARYGSFLGSVSQELELGIPRSVAHYQPETAAVITLEKA